MHGFFKQTGGAEPLLKFIKKKSPYWNLLKKGLWIASTVTDYKKEGKEEPKKSGYKKGGGEPRNQDTQWTRAKIDLQSIDESEENNSASLWVAEAQTLFWSPPLQCIVTDLSNKKYDHF